MRIVNQSGTTVATYEYDPWGKLISASELPSVENQPLRYAGYYYDVETEQYYLRAIYYDPETARFLSRDPDGGDKDNPLSQNLYAYANGDPVNNVDPDGEWAFLARIAINAAIYAYTTPRSQWSAWGFVSNSISFGRLFKGAKIVSKVAKQGGPIGKAGRKKQGREVNEKKRDKNWTSRSNKDSNRKMKKHTPGRDHRRIRD